MSRGAHHLPGGYLVSETHVCVSENAAQLHILDCEDLGRIYFCYRGISPLGQIEIIDLAGTRRIE